jgi:aerobic carbon-monoxide dehydrogenase large subunit
MVTLPRLQLGCRAHGSTGTLGDATAEGAPVVELLIEEAAALSNPLGVKGAGEAGTSGVGAAVANAVAAAVGTGAASRLPVTAPRIKAALTGNDQ